jgi:hypothetical protein
MGNFILSSGLRDATKQRWSNPGDRDSKLLLSEFERVPNEELALLKGRDINAMERFLTIIRNATVAAEDRRASG